MPKYFYQIKGKLNEPEQGFFGGVSNWSFPPIFSGIVEADSKKLAKKIIDEDYDRVFPLRVLSKDLKDNEFLLSIEEIKPHSHLNRLDELQTCNNVNCGKTFYVIDKYNDYHDKYKGSEYCSSECKDEDYQVKRQKQLELNNINIFENSINNNLNSDINKAIIYKITNKINNKCYIGKTTQIFTLRWYQHFFQSGNNKFHNEIKNVKVTDWLFEVIETIEYPEEVKNNYGEYNKYILERERFYINLYDSVNNGYNTLNT